MHLHAARPPTPPTPAFSPQATAGVYHAPGVDSAVFDSHAEETVGSLSCYFPVRFTPPKNDPHRITRQLVGVNGCDFTDVSWGVCRAWLTRQVVILICIVPSSLKMC